MGLYTWVIHFYTFVTTGDPFHSVTVFDVLVFITNIQCGHLKVSFNDCHKVSIQVMHSLEVESTHFPMGPKNSSQTKVWMTQDILPEALKGLGYKASFHSSSSETR